MSLSVFSLIFNISFSKEQVSQLRYCMYKDQGHNQELICGVILGWSPKILQFFTYFRTKLMPILSLGSSIKISRINDQKNLLSIHRSILEINMD